MSYSSHQLAHLDSETRRLCRRYIEEVVLRFSLCPWAEAALRKKSVQISVITDIYSSTQQLNEAARAVFSVMQRESRSSSELLLIVLPRAHLTRLEMDDLLRAVRALQRPNNRPLGDGEVELAPFALAAFHPAAEADTATAERLIPYLRRSPDPMIQAVRNSVLAKIEPKDGSGTAYFDLENLDLSSLERPPRESLRLRVAKANLETCQRAGIEEVDRVLRNLIDDRQKVHALIDSGAEC